MKTGTTLEKDNYWPVIVTL